MTDAIGIVRDRLSVLGWPVFDSDATGVDVTEYFLLIAPQVGRSDDGAVHDLSGGLRLIVRAVGIDPGQVRAGLLRSRGLLRGFNELAVEGLFSFEYLGCPRPVRVERVQRSPETNTNIFFVDDEYTVFFEPCESKE